MSKIGVHFGPHLSAYNPDIVADIKRIYGDRPGVALVMEGSSWIGEVMPKGSIVVGRRDYVFKHINLSLSTEEVCYTWGEKLARNHLPSPYEAPKVTHFMGICEPQFDTIMDGRRLGAFDAGLADALFERGLGFCGLNIAMGKGESTSTPTHRPVMEAYARSFHQWSEKYRLDLLQPKMFEPRLLEITKDDDPFDPRITYITEWPALVWGYHMYGSPGIEPQYLELRPWAYWSGDLMAIGLHMPPILGTEAGIDKVGVGGYRRVWHEDASEKYAEYIERWPTLCQQALGGCFFGYRMGEPWDEKGFEFSQDNVVLSAMAEANKGENMMDLELAMDTLWVGHEVRVSQYPAFRKVRLQHPELGDSISGEFDVEGYRFEEYVGGYIWAKIGDWANCHVATTREQLPK